MLVNVSVSWKIGKFFNVENIYLATILVEKETVIEDFQSKIENLPAAMIKQLTTVKTTFKESDIFYKDANGYTRFTKDGPETFVGDNSDKKGLITNVVPVLKYFNQRDLEETSIRKKHAIAVTTVIPLYHYNSDYNVK